MENQAVIVKEQARKLIGNWLRDQRIKSGLSQEKASKALGYCGRAYIARFENGYDAIPLEMLFDLADLYKIEVDEILEKLWEYEPEKAEKFNRLSEKFMKYHIRAMHKVSKRFTNQRIESMRTSNIEPPEAAHHIPFPVPFATTSRSTHRISPQKPDSLRNTLDILGCGGYPLRSAFYKSPAVPKDCFQVYSNIYYQKFHIFLKSCLIASLNTENSGNSL